MAVPEWLKVRDGALTPGVQADTLFVTIGGRPHYRLDVKPAAGAYTCAVTQTENGRRLDDGAIYPTADAARTGGLEELRMKLGW